MSVTSRASFLAGQVVVRVEVGSYSAAIGFSQVYFVDATRRNFYYSSNGTTRKSFECGVSNFCGNVAGQKLFGSSVCASMHAPGKIGSVRWSRIDRGVRCCRCRHRSCGGQGGIFSSGRIGSDKRTDAGAD